jgi:hypothetical protein
MYLENERRGKKKEKCWTGTFKKVTEWCLIALRIRRDKEEARSIVNITKIGIED